MAKQRFKLGEGCGNHIGYVDGVRHEYKAGDVLESDSDLTQVFKGKFTATNDPLTKITLADAEGNPIATPSNAVDVTSEFEYEDVRIMKTGKLYDVFIADEDTPRNPEPLKSKKAVNEFLESLSAEETE